MVLGHWRKEQGRGLAAAAGGTGWAWGCVQVARRRAASGVPEMPFAESDAGRRWAAGVGRLCDSLRAKEVALAG